MICDLNDWIIVVETLWILCNSQLIGDIALEIVLNIQNELTLDQRFLQKSCLDIENINELSDSYKDSDLV